LRGRGAVVDHRPVSSMHRSDSLEQREAEPLIRSGVEAALGGTTLTPTTLTLPNGARVDVDGVDDEQRVFVEIFAKQGRLRGAQFHKVARDALKLITITKDRPETRRIVAFADQQAADCVLGKSWLAEALTTWGIEVLVVELDEEIRAGLRAAQARQVMMNPAELDSTRDGHR
jgi:hypothetical protein